MITQTFIRFEDLKSGLNHMKDKIGSKTVSSSDALLKNNISSFMDAIKIMKGLFKQKILKL